MFEVIISTISTGRVQRKAFATMEQARRYFDRYDAAVSLKGNRIYRVELERRELPVVRALPARTTEAARTVEAA